MSEMTLKAFYAGYKNDDWVITVHGETPGKAKSMFMRVDPSGNREWNYIRLTRIPQWDNRPFEDCNEYRELFTPDTYDPEDEPIYFSKYIDCACPLCRKPKGGE